MSAGRKLHPSYRPTVVVTDLTENQVHFTTRRYVRINFHVHVYKIRQWLHLYRRKMAKVVVINENAHIAIGLGLYIIKSMFFINA